MRDQYQPTSKFGQRGHGNFHGNGSPSIPTDARPGTEAKVRELIERARNKQQLFYPADAPYDDQSGAAAAAQRRPTRRNTDVAAEPHQTPARAFPNLMESRAMNTKPSLRERLAAHRANRIIAPRIDVQAEPPAADLPVVTPAQLAAQTATDTPRYADGFSAGQRWALTVAEFDDLEHLASDSRSPFQNTLSWTTGFIAGAVAVWREVNKQQWQLPAAV